MLCIFIIFFACISDTYDSFSNSYVTKASVITKTAEKANFSCNCYLKCSHIFSHPSIKVPYVSLSASVHIHYVKPHQTVKIKLNYTSFAMGKSSS